VFHAIWVEGRDMNDAGTVGAVLRDAGFEAQQILSLTSDAEVKEHLKTVTAHAVGRGVFGAPTFFVGDQMFWGQDRLDFVEEALKP
jgi:2-hydroxychromene-2-carboxylate isomerase